MKYNISLDSFNCIIGNCLITEPTQLVYCWGSGCTSFQAPPLVSVSCPFPHRGLLRFVPTWWLFALMTQQFNRESVKPRRLQQPSSIFCRPWVVKHWWVRGHFLFFSLRARGIVWRFLRTRLWVYCSWLGLIGGWTLVGIGWDWLLINWIL